MDKIRVKCPYSGCPEEFDYDPTPRPDTFAGLEQNTDTTSRVAYCPRCGRPVTVTLPRAPNIP